MSEEMKYKKGQNVFLLRCGTIQCLMVLRCYPSELHVAEYALGVNQDHYCGDFKESELFSNKDECTESVMAAYKSKITS